MILKKASRLSKNTIQAYDNCEVYVNGVYVSPEYVSRIDLNTEKHFEEFTTLPLKKYYKINGLYEQPSVKVINSFGEEITPTVNNTTGVYETPLSAPKDIEEEIIPQNKKDKPKKRSNKKTQRGKERRNEENKIEEYSTENKY